MFQSLRPAPPQSPLPCSVSLTLSPGHTRVHAHTHPLLHARTLALIHVGLKAIEDHVG